MPDGIAGKGTKFRRWDKESTTPSWEKLANVKDISGPSQSRDTYDDTTYDNTVYKSFIAGLIDPGDITFTMHFYREGYETLKGDFESDTPGNYEIVLPDADNTSLEFEGLVTELPPDIPVEDVVTLDVTIKITGEVVLNSGAESSAP